MAISGSPFLNVRFKNLGIPDKKSSHKIKHRKIPREHKGFQVFGL